jgi:hypothetical protein
VNDSLDLDARIDALELLLWSDGSADVLAIADGRCIHTIGTDAARARWLLHWLRREWRPTLRELLDAHRRTLLREAVGAGR